MDLATAPSEHVIANLHLQVAESVLLLERQRLVAGAPPPSLLSCRSRWTRGCLAPPRAGPVSGLDPRSPQQQQPQPFTLRLPLTHSLHSSSPRSAAALVTVQDSIATQLPTLTATLSISTANIHTKGCINEICQTQLYFQLKDSH